MQCFVRLVAELFHVIMGLVGGVPALIEGMGVVTGSLLLSAVLGGMVGVDVVLVFCADPTRTHLLVKIEFV